MELKSSRGNHNGTRSRIEKLHGLFLPSLQHTQEQELTVGGLHLVRAGEHNPSMLIQKSRVTRGTKSHPITR